MSHVRLTIAGCLVAAAAMAMPARAQSDSERWLAGLTTIAAAWYVDNSCKILDTAGRRALEWHAVLINEALLARRVEPDRLNAVARNATAAPRMADFAACGSPSRKLVEGAVALAPSLLKEVANKVYDPKTSYRDYALARLAKITAAIRMAERCKYMTKEIAEDVKRVQTRVTTGMVDSYGGGALYDSLRRGYFDEGGDHFACSDAAQQIYLRALADLRELEAEFAAKP